MPDNVCDDASSQILEDMKTTFFKKQVVVMEKEKEEIETKTRGQSDNEMWRNERRKRLTASKVGMIAKMRKNTKTKNKVEQLLYSRFKGNAATQYGLEMEDTTRNDYMKHLHVRKSVDNNSQPSITNCGLFVSITDP